jgi:hypothetical protein
MLLYTRLVVAAVVLCSELLVTAAVAPGRALVL